MLQQFLANNYTLQQNNYSKTSSAEEALGMVAAFKDSKHGPNSRARNNNSNDANRATKQADSFLMQAVEKGETNYVHKDDELYRTTCMNKNTSTCSSSPLAQMFCTQQYSADSDSSISDTSTTQPTTILFNINPHKIFAYSNKVEHLLFIQSKSATRGMDPSQILPGSESSLNPAVECYKKTLESQTYQNLGWCSCFYANGLANVVFLLALLVPDRYRVTMDTDINNGALYVHKGGELGDSNHPHGKTYTAAT
eukprot:jgi/Psemu1/6027/gm1.6027_g